MKPLIVVWLFLLSTIFGTIANATLIDQSKATDSVVYDTVSNEYWIRDLPTFYGVSFDTQMIMIGQLNTESYFGIDTWHMASLSEMRVLWNNLPASFTSFNHDYVEGGVDHYFGRYNSVPGAGSHYGADVSINLAPPPDQVIVMSPLETIICPDPAPTSGPANPSAWVIADPPVATPEPHTLVLLAAGLLGLAVYGKRRLNGSAPVKI